MGRIQPRAPQPVWVYKKPRGKVGRPKLSARHKVVSVHALLRPSQRKQLKELAAKESKKAKRTVSSNELIRRGVDLILANEQPNSDTE